MKKLPTYFLAHGGGPWPFMEENANDLGYKKLANYIANIGKKYEDEAKFVVLISSHFEAKNIVVMTNENPKLNYDYYGFPANTYNLTWNAKSDKKTALQIIELLNNHGITAISGDNIDYDHASFVPLMLAFPNAKIPIIQISINHNLDELYHYKLGEALANLRQLGGLIIGSGMSFHNMNGFFSQKGLEESIKFDSEIEKILELPNPERKEKILNWKSLAGASYSHPRHEHLIPLISIFGAGGEDTGIIDFKEQILGVELICVRFGRI
ncbi:MAG: class III extradiol ring-cleavage dioxygenase [Candidatus Gracilibacteria bacterium]|nr:class III extradiol ring-cleavage dioxygenase [Candidatus Gracilibacteria bacterium]